MCRARGVVLPGRGLRCFFWPATSARCNDPPSEERFALLTSTAPGHANDLGRRVCERSGAQSGRRNRWVLLWELQACSWVLLLGDGVQGALTTYWRP